MITKHEKEKYKNMNIYKLNEQLCDECLHGNLEKIEYLLTSKELSENANILFYEYLYGHNVCNRQYDEPLNNACESGNIKLVKFLLTSPKLLIHSNINVKKDIVFKSACLSGNLELVDYLLNSKELTAHSNIDSYLNTVIEISLLNKQTELTKWLLKSSIHEDLDLDIKVTKDNEKTINILKYLKEKKHAQFKVIVNKEILNDLLIKAAYEGNIEIVEYLLKDQELNRTYNSNYDLDNAFINACKKDTSDHIAIIKFLLTDKTINKNANIHAQKDEGLHMACHYECLNIIKYITKSSDLIEHADIHADQNWAFQIVFPQRKDIVDYFLNVTKKEKHMEMLQDYNATFEKALELNFLEIIEHMIFILEIDETKKIKVLIEEHVKPEIKEMFKKRELEKKLQNDLLLKTTQVIKNKI